MGGMQAYYTVFGEDDDELLSYYFDYREDEGDDMGAQVVGAADEGEMGEVREKKTPLPASQLWWCTPLSDLPPPMSHRCCVPGTVLSYVEVYVPVK